MKPDLSILWKTAADRRPVNREAMKTVLESTARILAPQGVLDALREWPEYISGTTHRIAGDVFYIKPAVAAYHRRRFAADIADAVSVYKASKAEQRASLARMRRWVAAGMTPEEAIEREFGE